MKPPKINGWLTLLLAVSGCVAPVFGVVGLAPLRNDTDPTKPVLFSLRNEYYNLLSNAWINQTILRADRVVMKNVGLPGGAKGSILRFDIPFGTVNTGTRSESGLADLYAQSLLVPRIRRGFTVAYGTGLVAPTASDRLLGGGKWQIAPAIVPAKFLPHHRGLSYTKFQDFISFAGQDDRAKIHQFLVTPTLLHRLSNRWFTLVDTESRTDWNSNANTSMKSGLEIGYMFSSRLGGWVKVEVPWGEHRTGDWTLKTTLFATRF